MDGRLKLFLDEVRALLNEWDPLGVCPGQAGGPPEGEYDGVRGPLVNDVARGVPEDAIVRRLQELVRRDMGIEAEEVGMRCLVRRTAALWDRLGRGS